MSEWIDIWNNVFPDWKDVGRRIELLFHDGRIVAGTLQADDWYDIPIFSVKTDTGEEVSIFDADKYRFIK
jgi:hypothetical protein